MRIAARVDDNHTTIVAYFRKFGCAVFDVHAISNGCDLFVSKNMKTFAIEIKDGSKSASEKKLTAGEQKFKDKWLGNYMIVENLSDVIAVVKALER